LLLVSLAGVAARAEESNLILEGSGEAGGFRLGAKVRAYSDLSEVGGDAYAAAGGGIRLLTDGREISEIRVLDKRYVTQKLIRPAESTLAEVLETYGDPRRRCTVDGWFAARYDGFAFRISFPVVGPLRAGDLERLLASPVDAVILRRTDDYKALFERGFEAYEAQDWPRLALLMERTLCDQSDSEPPARLRTYGMKFLDYTPHYLLGLAWWKLGRCEAALAEWTKSEEKEDIERIEERYARILEGRQACATTALPAAR
jgi:hypothetical protein